jgi:hypothetical protein
MNTRVTFEFPSVESAQKVVDGIKNKDPELMLALASIGIAPETIVSATLQNDEPTSGIPLDLAVKVMNGEI